MGFSLVLYCQAFLHGCLSLWLVCFNWCKILFCMGIPCLLTLPPAGGQVAGCTRSLWIALQHTLLFALTRPHTRVPFWCMPRHGTAGSTYVNSPLWRWCHPFKVVVPLYTTISSVGETQGPTSLSPLPVARLCGLCQWSDVNAFCKWCLHILTGHMCSSTVEGRGSLCLWPIFLSDNLYFYWFVILVSIIDCIGYTHTYINTLHMLCISYMYTNSLSIHCIVTIHFFGRQNKGSPKDVLEPMNMLSSMAKGTLYM